MRVLPLLVVLAGCSGKADAPATHTPLVVPTVSSDKVLAAEPAKPPLVVVLDDSGLAVATDLALTDVQKGSAEEISRIIRRRAPLPPAHEIDRNAATRGPLGGQAARPRGDGLPSRVASVGGEVMRDGILDPLYAMLVTAPTTKATRVIDAVTRLDVAIAVSYAGTVRPLRIQFVVDRAASTEEPAGWIEVRVSPTGIAIEAVPDKPIELATLDPKQLWNAIATARKVRGIDRLVPIDVLVTPDVDAQRLVDVLVALDVAGVRMLGMGAVPTGEEANRRGHRISSLLIGQGHVQGDVDKDDVDAVVKHNEAAIRGCYEAALATTPKIEGTVVVMFFIAPTGVATAASASGVDPGVAKCVSDLVTTFVFPKPRGGGGAQVHYPFTFRS